MEMEVFLFAFFFFLSFGERVSYFFVFIIYIKIENYIVT